ncbi:MAG: galactokinase [Clostridia bacterium]|nr:galactokinase [Clostridia bacterium]
MAERKIIEKVMSEEFASIVKRLYGEDKLEYQTKRYKDLYDVHSKKYGDGGVFYSSPGRIEVCGNHTDHNNGKVLCASITVDTLACVTSRDDDKVIVESIGFSPIEISLNDILSKKDEEGKAIALVRGVLAYFKMCGLKVGGFSASTTSDVFRGAGVSSSACFEVLICEILNQMFNNGEVDKLTKAKAGHFAETEYFGKPCGLLDQSAIAFGGVSYIDFKSTKAPSYKSIDWNFDALNIVLINTGGDHSDLTEQYASIRLEMEAVANAMGAKKLRNVKEKDFYDAIPQLQKNLSGRALLRAIHFFDENKRVNTCANAVKSKNERKFCDMINASGESSYTMLQNCYPYGDLEQRIPLGINLSKKFDGVKAVRVHGGGFAGTIIAYVDKSKCDSYVDNMKSVFGSENVFVIGVRNDGTTKVF